MRVSLDKENRFIASDGKLDLKSAFRYAGIKAAWCYKKGNATPESIREMPEEELIRMGMDSFMKDHGTPREHQEISVEITGLPKLLCMILNCQQPSSACERSLRYTPVEQSEFISQLEVDLYEKWLKIYYDILWEKHSQIFLQEARNKGAKNVEKTAKTAARIIAQENARNFVTILVPTSIAYTTNWCQWQKNYIMLKDMVEHPRNDFERMAIPSAKELMRGLVDNRIVVSTKDAVQLCPKVQDRILDDREILYKDSKHIKLTIFGGHPNFKGFDKPDIYGSTISTTSTCSVPSLAQRLRHRTALWAMRELEEISFFTPPFIRGTAYEEENIRDMYLVKSTSVFPLGQNVEFNMRASLENIINHIGKERACMRAQWETADWYSNELLPKIVEGLKDKPEYAEERETIIRDYLNRTRCQCSDYECQAPYCVRPTTKRPY